jgi:Tfp pilus assembly protein PilP
MTMAIAALLLTIAWAGADVAEPQTPKPPAPIAAAKDAAQKVNTAQTTGNQPGGKEALEQSGQPQPAPAPAPPAGTAPAPAPGSQPPPPTPTGGYSYDPDGRRDPFVSLLARGADSRPNMATRPPGVAGMLIGEITVKGILRDKGGFIGIIQGADNKTYIVHQTDRLLDGVVKSITQDAIVLSQDVNDPLSLVKQREVRKTIRPEVK